MDYPDLSIEGIEHYPAVLRRPNFAGEPFHRTQNTIEKYRNRFKLLERRAHKMQQADQPLRLDEILYCVTRISAELANNTWLQYQAASMQAIRDASDLKLINERKADDLVEILDRHTRARSERTEKPDIPLRTSARRTKWIDQLEQDKIWQILSTRDPVDGALQMINDYGDRIGLRLSEWLNCSIENGSLTVKNAKYSKVNSKGLAPFRTLNLREGFCAGEIDDFEFGLHRLKNLVRHYGTDVAIRMLYRRLKEVADVVCPNRNITFRTYRDQFRSNMAADGYDRFTIAGSIGHSSADTQRRYEITRRGRKGMGLATCSPELALKVRPGANTTSRQNRRALERGTNHKREEQQSYTFTPFD